MANKAMFVFLLLLFGAVSFVSTLFLLGRSNQNKDNIILSEWEKNKAISKEQSAKDYQELLKKQEVQNIATNSGSLNLPQERKALGEQVINIVYVKPAEMPENEISLLLERLNKQDPLVFKDCFNDKCLENTSLNYVKTYIKNEATKYNIKDFKLDINTYGPYDLNGLGKVGDISYYWGKDPFGIAKLKDSFESTLKQNGLNFGDKDMVLFLYFDSSLDDTEANKNVGFYETKKFRSFAEYEKSRVYINVYNFSPLFASTVDKIVIHETMHLFGASDKYIEDANDRLCKEEGRGDIYKLPTFPQTSGDITCLFVEYEEGKFKAGQIYDGTLVVNTVSAREIGWIN